MSLIKNLVEGYRHGRREQAFLNDCRYKIDPIRIYHHPRLSREFGEIAHICSSETFLFKAGVNVYHLTHPFELGWCYVDDVFNRLKQACKERVRELERIIEQRKESE